MTWGSRHRSCGAPSSEFERGDSISRLAPFNDEKGQHSTGDELLHAPQTGLGHSGGLGADKQDWKTIESPITVCKY
jgi:hypothetical protein